MNSTLLVIDVQNDYFAPAGKLPLPDADAALSHIHTLVNTARATGRKVVHMRHERLEPEASAFAAGSDGVQMHPSMRVLPGEPVVLKHLPGSFSGTPLQKMLRAQYCKALVVCGFMTQRCCEMTTRQAFELGIPTYFASDATAALGLSVAGKTFSHQEIQAASLAVLSQFATVLSTSEIVEVFKAGDSSAPAGGEQTLELAQRA